ncbi:MAG: choice-of-anchor D domain-containing protein, partial [Terracidiphilus sp.]
GSDMRAAYYGGTLTGSGQTLGLLEYHGTDLADLQTYYTNAKQTYPGNIITLLSTDGTSTSCVDSKAGGNCDDTEQTLDMTQALGMAPGLSGLVMFVGSSDAAIFNSMATRTPLALNLSSSWAWSPADPSTDNPYFEEFAAQGQNLFQAAGDSSAWTSSSEIYPADDVYLTSVGGTDLTTSSAAGPWASETAWSDGGGGISPDKFAIPSWQVTAAASCSSCSQSYRNGPDVSANANFTYYVCADQTACTANEYGGTSFAAPLWAGYLALVNQQRATNGNGPLGFVNPTLYLIGDAGDTTYSTAFHDITSGSNGYSATTGYDLVTGWGSPNGTGLFNALTGTGTEPVASLSPALSFPNTAVGTTSSALAATLSNTGTALLNNIVPSITGANPGDFALTTGANACGSTLAAGSSCSIYVTFTPASAASFSATLSVADNASGSPQTVSLTGTGTAPAASLSPALSFPNTLTGTTSSALAATLSNTGTGALNNIVPSITGTNPGDFALTTGANACGSTLAAGSNCSIYVTFTPASAASFSATLSVADNASGSPQTSALSGTGVTSGPTTWPNGYSYEATFTVAAGQVPSAQTNFPALISGTYADFATTANGGRINNTCTQVVGNNSTAAPCDLIFTSDAAGTQLLSWEFETWNAANGAVNIWVNVPNLANGTVIYAWYGQSSVTTLETTPSATWTNYMAVYHMKENPAGTAPQLNDSTANGNNATMNGSVLASQQQTGEIDGSINFEGDTWASLASSSVFSFERTDSFSLSGWYKIGSNTIGSLLTKIPQPINAGWALMQYAGSSSPQIALDLWGTNASTGAYAETPPVSIGVWHYVVATYSGTGNTAGMSIYIDGVNQTLTPKENNLATSILNSNTPSINSRGNTDIQNSNDAMDELRVSAKGVVYSAAWVTATYNNESSPGTFFTAVTGMTNP